MAITTSVFVLSKTIFLVYLQVHTYGGQNGGREVGGENDGSTGDANTAPACFLIKHRPNPRCIPRISILLRSSCESDEPLRGFSPPMPRDIPGTRVLRLLGWKAGAISGGK
ncbi:hypothetical protein CK203_109280 [Vitis vinifera]|uniref:Secreted protein n=1 Tax=Vitis vinifera TaxID=29760 RepID=A0A438DAC8_VITVI|nr:hypothetical protein CK203_109280 [Vitis vinifera]